MKNKHVVIVNGPPRAGKDTLVEFMRHHLHGHGIQSFEWSSIEPVKNITEFLHIDTSQKTEADRALWSEIGDSLEKHSYWRSRKCIKEITEFFQGVGKKNPAVFFLHVREPVMIERVVNNMHPTKVHTVLLTSPRSENIVSNSSDAGVFKMMYDLGLHNDGSKEKLSELALSALGRLKILDQESV